MENATNALVPTPQAPVNGPSSTLRDLLNAFVKTCKDTTLDPPLLSLAAKLCLLTKHVMTNAHEFVSFVETTTKRFEALEKQIGKLEGQLVSTVDLMGAVVENQKAASVTPDADIPPVAPSAAPVPTSPAKDPDLVETVEEIEARVRQENATALARRVAEAEQRTPKQKANGRKGGA